MARTTKTASERLQQSERLRRVKRKPGQSKKYFTQENEDAIVEYVRLQRAEKIEEGRILAPNFRGDVQRELEANKRTHQHARDQLFRTLIYPVFVEIINNIVNVYKFNYLPNIEDRKTECVRLLSEKIHYFDPDLGFKAFSYFSVITKHWWLNEAKKYKQSSNQEEEFEEFFVLDDSELGAEEELIRQEDWDDGLQKRLDALHCIARKDTNLNAVVQEIIEFIGTYQNFAISSYTRKAFVDHVSERTGLTKQQVLNSLYRLKKTQKDQDL